MIAWLASSILIAVLLLLSGITYKLNLGNGAVECALINQKIVYFSPCLPFENIDFSFDIFNKLK
jgi:hypothetical protein